MIRSGWASLERVPIVTDSVAVRVRDARNRRVVRRVVDGVDGPVTVADIGVVGRRASSSGTPSPSRSGRSAAPKHPGGRPATTQRPQGRIRSSSSTATTTPATRDSPGPLYPSQAMGSPTWTSTRTRNWWPVSTGEMVSNWSASATWSALTAVSTRVAASRSTTPPATTSLSMPGSTARVGGVRRG